MTTYWMDVAPEEAPIDEWVEQFNRDGCLILRNVLRPEFIEELRADIDRGLDERPQAETHRKLAQNLTRVFENSPAHVRLFALEPIVSFAEKLVAANCTVVHNNGLRTPPGFGIINWHQDDLPHYVVTEGEPPTNVRLPCLLFTANYLLSDAPTPAHGPTQVIPGSHLFGRQPPGPDLRGTEWEEKIVSATGPAGTVCMFNNQVWHRGGPNESDSVRYVTQVSYGRRIIGHMYLPFMNYVMPEQVYAGADDRTRRLLGFKERGPYN